MVKTVLSNFSIFFEVLGVLLAASTVNKDLQHCLSSPKKPKKKAKQKQTIAEKMLSACLSGYPLAFPCLHYFI